MKRILVLMSAICCLFTACNDSSIGVIGGADGPTSIIVSNKGDKWGLTLRAENVTKTGMTIIFEQSGGNPSGRLEYGAAYALEKKVNEKWQEVETKTGQPLNWTLVGYSIKMNDITEMKIDWSNSYGELSSGLYRLKKDIMDFRIAGDYDTKTYEVYFTIEEKKK